MILNQFLILGAFLFSLGMYGVLVRRNAVLVLLSVELMLAAVNINLVAFDAYLRDAIAGGQIFTLFVIAIVLLIFRNRQSANVDEMDLMKL